MAPFNHSEAERIVTDTDVKRYDQGTSRSDALLADDKPEPKQPAKPNMPRPRKNNAVLKEMQHQKDTSASDVVFSKVREALTAAEASCQKAMTGVQSKQAVDAALERTLNDLILVIAGIRDDRKEIIRDRSAEEKAHPALIS